LPNFEEDACVSYESLFSSFTSKHDGAFQKGREMDNRNGKET
jgi:hypothetical protein